MYDDTMPLVLVLQEPLASSNRIESFAPPRADG